jgi:hypothetical protein
MDDLNRNVRDAAISHELRWVTNNMPKSFSQFLVVAYLLRPSQDDGPGLNMLSQFFS